MEDFLYKFLSVYSYFPLPVKQLIGKFYNFLPREVRYGSFYRIYTKRLKYFNDLDNIQEVLHQQERLLHEQVKNSIDTIPYYKDYELYESIENFQKYRVINKKTILKSFSDFANPELKNKRLRTNTGGSSGTPMTFFIEKNISRAKERANFDWNWGQFGYKPNDKMLMAKGLPLKGNRLFEYNSIDNILNVSCYNINEENVLLILKKINQFKPLFILAYPSSLKVITSLLKIHKDRIDFNVKAIFLQSEQLMESDRGFYERFYNTKVVTWYGHTEKLIFGGNCPFSNEFHFYPAYGYMELLDENNNVISQPGKEGRIIATGFDNKVMPFIRYDTGDLGVLSGETHCKCGFRGISLSRISGRKQDLIVLSDHTKVSLTAFIFGQHLKAFERVREIQVVQNTIGEIELRIIKNSDYTLADEESLRKSLINSVNNKIQIQINYVENLPKTQRGKNIFFVTNLKDNI